MCVSVESSTSNETHLKDLLVNLVENEWIKCDAKLHSPTHQHISIRWGPRSPGGVALLHFAIAEDTFCVRCEINSVVVNSRSATPSI